MNSSNIKKYVLIGLGVLVILIQFFGTLPGTNEDLSQDLISNGHAAGEVSDILQTSCYDCHSNQTVYPWYSNVAPVKWLISHDVEEGREELNFSEWETFTDKRKLKKLEEVVEEVMEDEMPLPIYTSVHGDAKLNKEQKDKLVAWSKTLMTVIKDGDLSAISE